MHKRMLIFILFSSFTILLAGCNQSVDDLLKIGEDIFQELMGDSSNDSVTTDMEQGSNEITDSMDNVDTNQEGTSEENQQDDDSDLQVGDYVVVQGGEHTPFHLYLQEVGYNLYSLPNGFPIELPYHWVLVDGAFGENNHFFEGDFCYQLPYEEDDLPDVFGNYTGADVIRNGGDNNYFEKTIFTLEDEFESTSGLLNYYTDENDISCVFMAIDEAEFESYDGEYGEDPATMIGPGDPHYEEVMENQAAANTGIELANDHVLTENRQRKLPDNYDDLVKRLLTSNLSENDGAQSIRQQIKTGNLKLNHVTSGFARILPYEWYAIDLNTTNDGMWSGEFCTDLTIEQSLVAHLDMLENFNADIVEFSIDDGSPELAKIRYAYNDAYGTGSWSGQSWFNHTENTSDNSGMRCINVDLQFSTDILQ